MHRSVLTFKWLELSLLKNILLVRKKLVELGLDFRMIDGFMKTKFNLNYLNLLKGKIEVCVILSSIRRDSLNDLGQETRLLATCLALL